VRAQAQFFRRDVQTWRTVKTIAIEQGNRWHLKLCAAGHQYLRQRSAFEKAERRARM
jgi:hypothetical protein